MLKRTIKYEDFNGVEQEEVFYFNISKSELIELEVEHEVGFGDYLQNIVEAKDSKSLVKEFQKIILLAYGKRSDDGKVFLKSDKDREEFKQSAAYNALFMELATDSDSAVTFIQGVLPQDLAVQTREVVNTGPLPPTDK